MLAVTAVMMAFTACTREVVIVKESDSSLQLGPGEDVIRINLTSTSNTRAARPITNSLGDNNINRIAFKFLCSNGTEYNDFNLEGVIDTSSGEPIEGYSVDNDNKVLLLSNTPENNETINIKFSNLGENTAYRIIAYGYNVYNDDNDVSFPLGGIEVGEKINNTGQKIGQPLLKCEDVEGQIEEIFAGTSSTSSYISVNQHGKFQTSPTIEMKRQVAALLAYFKNVPIYVNNTKVEAITVSTKVKISGFCFPAELLGSDNDNYKYNGIGSKEGEWNHYLKFKMSKASNYDNEYDIYYEFGDDEEGKQYQLAEGMDEIPDLECKDNTLFGSCFLLPFDSYKNLSVSSINCATLNICYWADSDCTDMIISKPLRLSISTEPVELSDEAFQYGILCNNFYSIGKKTSTEIDKETDPDVDDENNQPLDIDESTGYDHCVLTINNDFDKTNELTK